MWPGPRGTTATSRCELHRGGSEPTSRRQLAQASHGVIHGGREGWWIWVKLCQRCIKEMCVLEVVFFAAPYLAGYMVQELPCLQIPVLFTKFFA